MLYRLFGIQVTGRLVFFNMTRAEFFCDSIYRYYETGLIGVCGVISY